MTDNRHRRHHTKWKPGLRRYLRRTSTGLLRIDHAAAKGESHLDGKWRLRTSDPTLTPEDLALACNQLLAVECYFRRSTLKLAEGAIHLTAISVVG